MAVQVRQPTEVKKAVNRKTKGRKAQIAKEARLQDALERGRNALVDCPRSHLDPQSLNLDGDIYKPDTDSDIRAIKFIEKYKFMLPVLVRGADVVDGHDMVRAAIRLEYPTVECVHIDHLSKADANLLKIALHQLRTLKNPDIAQFKLILEDVEPIDFEYSFLLDQEIDAILSDDPVPSDGEEELPAVPENPVSRLGDRFMLRDHRIACGDATCPESYEALLAHNEARAVITDFPYNVPIAGHVSGLGKIKHNDFVMASGEMSPQQFLAFMISVWTLLRRYCLPHSALASFIDWRSISAMIQAAETAGLTLINLAVWKKSGGMGAFLRSAHELFPIFCSGDQLEVQNVMLGKHGRDRTNVWDYPSANQRGGSANAALALHSTPKNVEMIEDFIYDVTNRGDVVLDPFLGSGTTIIAAQKAGRCCYGIELDPKYVDVCIRRWEKMTGDYAIHEASGLSFAQLAEMRRAEGDEGIDQAA
jgi:DNA modification methylase